MDTSNLSVAVADLAADLRLAFRRARELGFRGVELDARTGLDPSQAVQEEALRDYPVIARALLGLFGGVVTAISFSVMALLSGAIIAAAVTFVRVLVATIDKTWPF